jgi:hypothetical protein
LRTLLDSSRKAHLGVTVAISDNYNLNYSLDLTQQIPSKYPPAVGKRLGDINMVAAAVRIAASKLGATDKRQYVKVVSAHLKVTSAAVYKWIDQRHMRRAALETALALSDLSGVSVRDLAGLDNRQTSNDDE